MKTTVASLLLTEGTMSAELLVLSQGLPIFLHLPLYIYNPHVAGGSLASFD